MKFYPIYIGIIKEKRPKYTTSRDKKSYYKISGAPYYINQSS